MSPGRYWSVRVDLMVDDPSSRRDSQFPPAMTQDAAAGDDSSERQEDESG